MSFKVKIEVYEGPFDLLLQLISRQELNIHEVPVAQITASYLEHIERATTLDLDVATEFLLTAATLLLIKARSLLPSEDDETLEEDESESARKYLLDRLVEYKTFSSAAACLEERYAEHGWYTPRLREIEMDYAHLYPDPFRGVGVEKLPETLLGLLADRAGTSVDTTHIAPIKISVADHVRLVRETLESRPRVTFGELAAGCESRLEVIATFLAILEMYKKGEVKLAQRRLFGEITVSKPEDEDAGAA